MVTGGKELKANPSSKRASVILFGLCVIAASTVAGAAVVRYVLWGDQLPGGFSMSPVDLDGEGSAEYLIASAAVELPESGDYTAVGTLLNPATGASVVQTTGRVEMDRGEDIFSIGFWAPDIRKAEVSGPYTMQLTFIREQSDSIFERPADPDMVGRLYQWTFTTPAYDWRSFQAQPADIAVSGPATAVRTDSDGDGIVDAYAIDVPVAVHKTGTYAMRVQADGLTLPGVTDRFFFQRTPTTPTGSPQFVFVGEGAQDLQFPIPAEQLYLSGVDGAFDAHVTITSGTQTTTSHPCCGTVDTSFSESPAFAPPPDGSVFGLRQPYLLPPTPIGTTVEAHLADVVHWYDFRAPWMPIEFTGDVRDQAVDLDNDGLFDYLSVSTQVIVRNLGTYDLSGTLYAAGAESSDEVLVRSTPNPSSIVTTSWTRLQFTDWQALQGPQNVQLAFTGAEILAAGLSGPFEAKLRIVPANVVIDPVVAHTTATYEASQFEATGAKPARLPAVTVTSPSVGAFEVRLGSWSGGDGYSVMVRIIHANGVVATDATAGAGYLPAVYFRTDAARAHDFAVAVYLMGPTGAGVDYIEIPLTV